MKIPHGHRRLTFALMYDKPAFQNRANYAIEYQQSQKCVYTLVAFDTQKGDNYYTLLLMSEVFFFFFVRRLIYWKRIVVRFSLENWFFLSSPNFNRGIAHRISYHNTTHINHHVCICVRLRMCVFMIISNGESTLNMLKWLFSVCFDAKVFFFPSLQHSFSYDMFFFFCILVIDEGE